MIITIAGGLFVSAALAAKYALESALGSTLIQGMQSALGLFSTHPAEAIHLLADTVDAGKKISDLAKPHKHQPHKKQQASAPEAANSSVEQDYSNGNTDHPRYGRMFGG